MNNRLVTLCDSLNLSGLTLPPYIYYSGKLNYYQLQLKLKFLDGPYEI